MKVKRQKIGQQRDIIFIYLVVVSPTILMFHKIVYDLHSEVVTSFN